MAKDNYALAVTRDDSVAVTKKVASTAVMDTLAILEPLDNEERAKVLRAVVAFYDLRDDIA